MRKTKILFVMMLALVLSNAVVSCKKDPAPQETKTVDNPELATKLKALGFAVEGSVITIDNKVQNTTSLDLSAAELTSVEGLEVFPKLEEVNLSDNHFTNTFDFAGLPKTVKRVNLAGNELFQFEGLATVTDNGFTLQRELTELTLPASARFNVDLLPFYYNETKGKVTLKMQNPTNNQIEPYTTLRNIPDETLREYLAMLFPSIMTENKQIDTGKLLSGEDSVKDFNYFMFFGVENWNGMEFIINRPDYRPSTIIFYADSPTIFTAPYLIIPETAGLVSLGVDTKLDFSKAKGMFFIRIQNNNSLEVLDLTHCPKFLDRELSVNASQDTGSLIVLYNCANVTEIKMAEDAPKNSIDKITLVKLPKLTSFNTDKFIGVNKIYLAELPKAEFNMPDIQQYTNTLGQLEENGKFSLSITKDMIANKKVKDFIIKYGKLNRLEDDWDRSDIDIEYHLKPYDYRYLYQSNE